MSKLFARPDIPWITSALLACAMLAGAVFLPLWRMELVAPQYPAGLVMKAYGYKFAEDPNSYYDDLREINGLNHYIGMKPIKEVTEMKLFVPGIAALIAGTVLGSFVAWQRRWLRLLLIAGFWVMPLFFIADLQFWLYRYGHTMDPHAALNTGSFTPKVFGSTKVWNFHSETQFEPGFYLMLGAALVITAGPLLGRLASRLRVRKQASAQGARGTVPSHGQGRATALKVILLLALAGLPLLVQARASAQDTGGSSLTLQQRIDAARPEDIIVVSGGAYHERIVIDKPVSLIGREWPVIDGDGQGDVVTITADDAVLSGFVVQNGGRNISQEPAAIKVRDADRVTISGNRVRQAHAGIHITGSEQSLIEANDIDTGADTAIERRGHAVYLWEVSRSTVYDNDIRNAADGIHLEFSPNNVIGENRVSDSRYALHFMYAHNNKMVHNAFTDNLSGAVLMFSRDLVVKGNEFSNNRAGATGAGMLLKETDNIFVEDNRLVRNKYGLFIEDTPQAAGATAVFRNNLLALNDVGIGLTSNAPITFVENSVIDNGIQVQAIGGELTRRAMSDHTTGEAGGAVESGGQQPRLPAGAVWSSNGRGNYWSDYRGYDQAGDGVGDQPYRPRPAFAGRLGEDETLRLFQFTPAQEAIDLAADMFPVYRYNAVIEDGYPLQEPPTGLTLPGGSGRNVPLLIASALLAGFAAALIIALGGFRDGALIPGRVGRRHARGGLAA
ncbi:MAG: nitrous oxide reductase family maturation protein NosD [Chloroflexi bacterium]|nr:nitrous oxide reductase family maturation protein NosD [Chloroflexota bacterium]